jgi:two-component system LytT family sensor kinase
MQLVNYFRPFSQLDYKCQPITLILAMVSSPSKQNWFTKYRLYHIPFWIVYNFIWWWIVVGHIGEAARDILTTTASVKFFFYACLQILAVCFNLYYLIPKFMARGKMTLYLIYLVLTILVTAFFIVPGYYLSAMLAGSTVSEMYGMRGNYIYLQLFIYNPLQSTLGCITLGMSIKLAKNWIETQRRQQALEKEKLETELKFLKYQFNPHFLFNSINSIFFLIHKNPDMASASLAKFSELLRHQLYESNDSLIPLKKELAYLENFIELERLRQSLNLQLNININDNHSLALGIAPFILMTFVENAFKHVSRDKDSLNRIDIELTIEKQHLHMLVANSKGENESPEAVVYGGIGLKNVNRRLDLVYPGQHTLDIQNHADNFLVKLDLELSELTFSASVEFIA